MPKVWHKEKYFLNIPLKLNNLEELNILTNEIKQINSLLFEPSGLALTNIEVDLNNEEYGGRKFKINTHKIIFRVAHTSPNRKGQTVSIWRRDNNGLLVPFNFADDFNFFIMAIKEKENFGIFIFPKLILILNKIITNKTVKGRRSMWLYPTWQKVTLYKSLKIQEWQEDFFIDLSPNRKIDLAKFNKKLLMRF